MAELTAAMPMDPARLSTLSAALDEEAGVLVTEGNLSEALKTYRRGLATRQLLLGADPTNAGWQRDVSISYDSIGEVLKDQGNLSDALKSFLGGLAIADRLAKANPNNLGLQRDLSVSIDRVADLQLSFVSALSMSASRHKRTFTPL